MAIDSLSDVNTLTARMLPMTEAAEAGDAMAS
jgi:hypothetical protein